MLRGALFAIGLGLLAVGLWWSAAGENHSTLTAVTLFFVAFTTTSLFTRLLRRKRKDLDSK